MRSLTSHCVLVDRHDRKKIMIGADLIIAAAGPCYCCIVYGVTYLDGYGSIVYPCIGTAFHTRLSMRLR